MKPVRSRDGLVDVDFSLAIHNRTGKYFIGRDLLQIADLPLGDVYYWRFIAQSPPAKLFGRIIGRLQHWQIRGQALGGAFGWLPRRTSRRPLLHLDPWTVATTHLRRCDAVLCHDIGPITHPTLFDADVEQIYGQIYRECERVGPHLIFVSEATRLAFMLAYPNTDDRRTRVIYPAMRPGVSAAAPEAVPGMAGPFLLTVGSVGDRKNQARCIAAFASSALAERGFSYVVCGGPEPGFERVAAAARSTPNVVLMPYVSDGQLAWLYANARGFVLASLLEGFGMPVAEAIEHGLVPLVSGGSVLEEVAGRGAVFADPQNINSIARGMICLADMQESDCSERLRLLGQSATRFDSESISASWRSAFADIIDYYENNQAHARSGMI